MKRLMCSFSFNFSKIGSQPLTEPMVCQLFLSQRRSHPLPLLPPLPPRVSNQVERDRVPARRRWERLPRPASVPCKLKEFLPLNSSKFSNSSSRDNRDSPSDSSLGSSLFSNNSLNGLQAAFSGVNSQVKFMKSAFIVLMRIYLIHVAHSVN